MKLPMKTNLELLQEHSELIDMLKYRRPAKSVTEEAFITRFIQPIEGIQMDTYGNYYVDVLDGDSSKVDTMFTAHTDSVHRTEGIQSLAFDNNTAIISLAKTELESNCLGADDATGIYIMRKMIDAGVPGLYVFFREEEIGGLGSEHFLRHHKEIWAGVRSVVSFDRAGATDIITHQSMGQSASTEFAQALAAKLPAGYEPCDMGVFTDSATFMDDIEECTNIAVGYDSEHTKNEYQMLRPLDDLLTKLLPLDWGALPIKRDPKNYDTTGGFWGNYDNYGTSSSSNQYQGVLTSQIPSGFGTISETDQANIVRVLEAEDFDLRQLQLFWDAYGLGGSATGALVTMLHTRIMQAGMKTKDLTDWYFME